MDASFKKCLRRSEMQVVGGDDGHDVDAIVALRLRGGHFRKIRVGARDVQFRGGSATACRVGGQRGGH